MPGPTDNLTPLGKVLATARALVAFDPDDFEDMFELEVAKLEYVRDHGFSSLVDTWVRVLPAGGRPPWYVKASSDGGGISQAKEPDAEIAVTFAGEGRRLAGESLRANVARLNSGDLDPGRPMTELDRRRLANAADAGEKDHRPAVLRVLAEAGPGGDAVVAMLDRMRAGYTADGYLTGEVMATVMIRETIDSQRPSGTPVRYRLGQLAQEAIDSGYGDAVQSVADALRANFADFLRRSQEEPDLEGHLEKLFQAVPFGRAAVLLYRALMENVREPRFARIHRQVQEDNARIRHAFVHQITDLGGLQWHLERQSIRALPHAEAEVAAKRLITARLYPPALLENLIASAEP